MPDRVGRVGALLFVLADGLFWATLFYLVVFHRLFVHDSRVEEYVRRTTPWPDVPEARPGYVAALWGAVALAGLAFLLDGLRRRLLAAGAGVAALLLAVGVLAWAAGHGLPFGRGRYGVVLHGAGTAWAVHLALGCVLLFLRVRAPREASPSRRFDPVLALVALAGAGTALVLT